MWWECQFFSLPESSFLFTGFLRPRTITNLPLSVDAVADWGVSGNGEGCFLLLLFNVFIKQSAFLRRSKKWHNIELSLYGI